jgi:hypothetical protein
MVIFIITHKKLSLVSVTKEKSKVLGINCDILALLAFDVVTVCF